MPDTRPATRPPPAADRLLAEFRPDPRAYFRAQAVLALLVAVAAMVVTQLLQMPGVLELLLPLAVALLMVLRGIMGQVEAMAGRWRLTDRRLAGPGGVALPLVEVAEISTTLGAVVITMSSGERHTIRHLADTTAAVDQISNARDEAKRRPRGGTVPPPVPVSEDAR